MPTDRLTQHYSCTQGQKCTLPVTNETLNECVAAPTKSWMWSCLFFADFAGLVKRAGPRLRELTYWPTQAVEVSSCNVGPRLFYHPGLVPVYLDVRLDAIPSSGSSDLAEVFFKS